MGQLFFERKETGFTDLPLLSLTDKEGIVRQEDTDRKNNSSADKSKYLRVLPGDIAYNTMRMWEGRSAYAAVEGVVSPAYTVCVPTEHNDSLFFTYYFKTKPLIAQFRKYSQGLVKDTLSLKYETFSRIEVATPSKLEQRKIAACLASLDKVIAAQRRKVDALKAHKQGLMQQLFPREAATVPRVRFRRFRKSKEWKQTKLEALAKLGSGHTPSRSKPEYYNGGIKWVSLADSKRLDSGYISETEHDISAAGIANSSAVLHAPGSVIVCRDAAIGKTAILKEPMAVSQHFVVWTCDSKLLSNWFLYYSLQMMKPLFDQVASGSTIKTIGLPFFAGLTLRIPALPEQQQIADCLYSLDARITTELNKLFTMNAHKKGLLQNLFPSAEEAR